MIVSTLCEVDVFRGCKSSYYDRGARYFREGRVLEIRVGGGVDEDSVTAVVKGSGRNIYRVEIDFTQAVIGVDIEGHCSCPVGYNCKHVVAVLLALIDLQKGDESSGLLVKSCMPSLDDLDQWKKKAQNLLHTDQQKYQNSDRPDSLLYVLEEDENSACGQWYCETIKSRILKRGGWGAQQGYSLNNLYDWHCAPVWVAPVDVDIARLLVKPSQRYGKVCVSGDFGFLAVKKMIGTGRCYYRELSDTPLTFSSPRQGELLWQDSSPDQRCLNLRIDGDDEDGICALLQTDPLLYIDTKTFECGLVELPVSSQELAVLKQLPPVAENKLAELALFIGQTFPVDTVPLPVELDFRSADHVPVPLLNLSRVARRDGRLVHIAQVRFLYQPCECVPTVLQGDSSYNTIIELDGVHWNVQQDSQAEIQWIRQLQQLGFVDASKAGAEQSGELRLLFTGATLEQSVARWKEFIDQIPQLEERGWVVRLDDSFSLQFSQPDTLAIQLNENSSVDWFEIGLDIEYNGQRLPMLPLLIRWLEQGGKNEPLLVQLEDGRWLHCPEEMITPVVNSLVELFDKPLLNDADQIKLHRSQIHQLSHLEQAVGDHVENLHWHGDELLRKLAYKLNDFKGIQPVSAPSGLGATLRDYQYQGVAWLQFLREYQFNGILADDMGLGKTIQALTHLLIEKESGRMETPALIVAPTSVLSNWQREAQRFTPDLRVLILHGAQRSDHFDNLDSYDLIITSYALLSRDQDIHRQHCYHLFILDEAQAIKNPTSKVAQVAGAISAKQRLCLTGTPVENHLGELWSLFHFLMPGFLGSQKRFNQLFRKPIEQHNNYSRQQGLQRRLLPFVLRRDKQQVASELPAKTTIICEVELGEAQTKLYETVRSAMSKKVRQLLKSKGLKKSHIEILDALLKLRQVCCDPRLVKLDSAKKLRGSAKLEQLMAMLEQQLEEGRKILLFSQFTSMLSLIEEELAARSISYTKLTGRTRKRDEAISCFQDGDVPLFLISLKAGGVGLNLTAADTVIHYDPWWNPAVENQATDRAHRIGQDKPVFVYKMIAQGTVEEKILQLQVKKQQLADGVYSGDRQKKVAKLTGDDLLALLDG